MRPYWRLLSPAQQSALAELERSGPELTRAYLKQLGQRPLSQLPPAAQAEVALLALEHAGEAMNALAASAGHHFSGDTAAKALLVFARTPPVERTLVMALLRHETTTPKLVDALVDFSQTPLGARPAVLGLLVKELAARCY